MLMCINDLERSIEIITAFLNDPSERLPGPGYRGGRPAAVEDVSAYDLLSLADLRGALHSLLRSGSPSANALEVVNRISRMVPMRVALSGSGDLRLEPSARAGILGTIGEVLAAVYAVTRAGLWSRLKICADPSCGRVFFDRTKNRSAVWCDRRVCGNRAKVRRYRERHGKTGRSAGP